MTIIAVGVGFICLVLYQLAMLIRESKGAVQDSRKIIKETEETLTKANALLDEATEIVNTVKGTITEVNNAIITPIRKISMITGVATSFIEGLSKRK